MGPRLIQNPNNNMEINSVNVQRTNQFPNNTFNTIINELNSGKHICLLSERSINKTGVGVEFFNNLDN